MRWVQALRRKDFTPSKGARVCSKHFSEDALDRTAPSRVRLRDGAVPTIFDAFPVHLKPKSKVRKPPVERQPVPPVSPPVSPLVTFVENEDIEPVTSPDKKTLKRKLAASEMTVIRCRKRIKVLLQNKRRLKKKNAELKNVITDLKRKDMISSSSVDVLETASGGVSDLLKRQIAKAGDHPMPKKYSAALRSFALTLHFYSPRAYHYVRTSFDTCLPHPRTIAKWYQNVDGKPGFTERAFQALGDRVKVAQMQEKKVVCSLVMDEIHIREHIEWDGSKYCGYIDMGTELDDDSLPIAKEALTFMVVSLNQGWKMPIGYFLINGLSGLERKNLVTLCLKKLHEVLVNVVSITHDGCAANLAMLKSLGVGISANGDVTSHFLHPCTEKPVYCFLDACHMLKLVRNTIAEKELIYVNKELVKWEYIKSLHKLQDGEGLHLGNNLRAKHMAWQKKKNECKISCSDFERISGLFPRFLSTGTI